MSLWFTIMANEDAIDYWNVVFYCKFLVSVSSWIRTISLWVSETIRDFPRQASLRSVISPKQLVPLYLKVPRVFLNNLSRVLAGFFSILQIGIVEFLRHSKKTPHLFEILNAMEWRSTRSTKQISSFTANITDIWEKKDISTTHRVSVTHPSAT